MKVHQVFTAALLAFVSASQGDTADITLSWGDVSLENEPRVSLFASSNVDVFKVELVFGYTFPNGEVTIGLSSLFPTLLDGEIEDTFGFTTIDLESGTITAESFEGLPIPAGAYTLTRFEFPMATVGFPFCIQSATFFNADLSIAYTAEGPGCVVIAEPDVRMSFRKPSINPSTNSLEVAVEAEVAREVFGFQMATEGSSNGSVSSESDANQFIDTIGSIESFLMVSFAGDFIPIGTYNNLIIFSFPLENEGNTFCVLDGQENTVFSGEAGEGLVHTGPGCVVLIPAPESCETSGAGDLNGDGILNIFDLILGRDIVLSNVEADECALATLDVTLDAVGDVLDLVNIVNLIVG